MEAQKLEDEIVDKGLTAPRVTLADIEDILGRSEAHYLLVPGTTVTICCIVVPNGFCLVGHSACASPENFDREIGRKLAYDRASRQLWELEGYRLRGELATTNV